MLAYWIAPRELWNLSATPGAPQIVDVRRRAVFDQSPHLLPAAQWHDFARAAEWGSGLDRARPAIMACKTGHELSQMAAAQLRVAGLEVQVLEGGYEGWASADLPFVAKNAPDRLTPARPSLWVTRRRPKIDRIACPWLIRRFADAEARFLFVEPADVANVVRESGAIPFGIADVERSHVGETCTFDTILKLLGLADEPALARLALIVRGADTARPGIAPEAAGPHAVSLGLSALAGDDDHGLLRKGFAVYDALFAWLRFAACERHNWPAKAA